MKIGPVTLLDVDAIESVFEKYNVQFEKSIDEGAAQELDDANRTTQDIPQFNGPKSLVTYDIPDSSVEIIKPTLEKLGYWHQTSDGSELEGDDYLCPMCDHHSHQMGLCPTHHAPLLIHSEWHALRVAGEAKKQKVAIAIVLTVVILFWVLGKGLK